MASVYSNEVAVGTYNRIRLRVDYNGTSASCHIEFRRTSTWTDTWGDDAAEITLNGEVKSAPYWYTGTVDTTWREIDSASGYTIPAAGGTVNWKFNNPLEQSVLGCSGTITLPSQGSAPSGGYINNLTSYWDDTNNEIRVHTTDAGVSDTGGLSLTTLNWNITESAYAAGIARCSIGLTNGSSSTLSNSLNTYSGSTIDIAPNKLLYRGLYAANAAGEYRYNGGTFVTVAAPITVSAGTITDTSVVINYSASADGGYYDKTIDYSLDGGTTWITGATITGGSATSGSFTISGLTAGTSYNIQTRANTTAGSTSGITVSITTTGGSSVKFYGPVSDGQGGYETKLVEKLYGPVSVSAYEVTALTKNTGFDATTFMSKWESTKGVMLYPATMLTTTAISGNMIEVRVRLDKEGGMLETITIFSYTTGAYNDEGAVWGFASEPQNGYFTSDSVTKTMTKKITKLYGAVAEQETTGVTGTIRSGSAGNVTAFDADTFWSKFITQSAYLPDKTVSYISLPSPAGTPLTTFADIFYTDNTYKRFADVTTAALAEYGITYASNPVSGSDYIDLTPISGTVYKTKLVFSDTSNN